MSVDGKLKLSNTQELTKLGAMDQNNVFPQIIWNRSSIFYLSIDTLYIQF